MTDIVVIKGVTPAGNRLCKKISQKCYYCNKCFWYIENPTIYLCIYCDATYNINDAIKIANTVNLYLKRTLLLSEYKNANDLERSTIASLLLGNKNS